jgi:hypothetical protein
MDAIVIYESVYGNTRDVATAIAQGLGGVPVLSVEDAQNGAGSPELVVVGAPTHIHGLSSNRTRRVAVDAARTPVESGATGPGVRNWLHGLDRVEGALAASFDTRAEGHRLLTGGASRGIARRLRHHGYDVVGIASFVVNGAEGPLAEGELERARKWGAELARAAARHSQPVGS